MRWTHSLYSHDSKLFCQRYDQLHRLAIKDFLTKYSGLLSKYRKRAELLLAFISKTFTYPVLFADNDESSLIPLIPNRFEVTQGNDIFDFLIFSSPSENECFICRGPIPIKAYFVVLSRDCEILKAPPRSAVEPSNTSNIMILNFSLPAVQVLAFLLNFALFSVEPNYVLLEFPLFTVHAKNFFFSSSYG